MEFYHLLNRGVEKRDIVTDDSDRLRFVHSLFIFNDRNPLDENHRRPGVTMIATERDRLVDIHAWCLMNNHYHLLVSPRKDQSDVSKFMKKLNMGYARYFNERHDRSGYLWQGKYKKILIEQDAHFMYIPYYIHLNPLDSAMKEWREGKVKNFSPAFDHLMHYRWSSFRDYQKHDNFKSVIESKTLAPVLGSPKNQINQMKQIVSILENAAPASRLE